MKTLGRQFNTKPAHLPSQISIVQTYYDDVAKHQLDLTPKEETNLYRALAKNRNDVRLAIIGCPGIDHAFHTIWMTHKARQKSTAKLGEDFNSGSMGRNAEIATRIDVAMHKLVGGHKGDGAKLVKDAGFSMNVYIEAFNTWLAITSLGADIGKPHPTRDKKRKEITRLIEAGRAIEDKLICSCLKMAHEVANRYSGVFGVDKADMIQESNRALVVAARLYDPSRRVNGKRVKFDTYAHWCCELIVKQWIMEKSRTVRIPKGKLRKILVVLKATNLMEGNKYDTEALTLICNRILAKRRGRVEGKLQTITEAEVADLQKLLYGNTIPLDVLVESDGADGERTLADVYPDEGMSVEDEVAHKMGAETLKAAVEKYLTPLQAAVVARRYLWHLYDPNQRQQIRSYDIVRSEIETMGILPPKKDGGAGRSREWMRMTEQEALEVLAEKCPNLRELLTHDVFAEASHVPN